MWQPLPVIKEKRFMSKIAEAFQDKKAFITYLMAGDPNLDQSAENILAAQEAGADLIEIGIPFSDPIAEGPVVENASVRALSAGVRLNNVFDMVASLQNEVKVVASQYGIEVITLIAPTSKDRIKEIAKKAEGFIYLVSSMGVTGVRSNITTDISAMVAEIRAVSDIPVAVGFGINQPSQVKDISAKANGVIVGSGIVRLVEAHGEEAKPYIYDYVHEMQAVLR